MSWTDDVDWKGRETAKADAERAAANRKQEFAAQQAPLLRQVVNDVALLPAGFKKSGRPIHQWHGAGMMGLPRITGWLCRVVPTPGYAPIQNAWDQVIATETGGFMLRTTRGASESADRRDAVKANAVRAITAGEAAKILLDVTDQPWRPEPDDQPWLTRGRNYLEERDGGIVHITSPSTGDFTDFIYDVPIREKLLSIVNGTYYVEGYTHGGQHTPGRHMDTP